MRGGGWNFTGDHTFTKGAEPNHSDPNHWALYPEYQIVSF